MNTRTRTTSEREPSLVSDLGAIAGLYRTVFWMIGQRLHYGPHWEEHFQERAHLMQNEQRSIEMGRPHRH